MPQRTRHPPVVTCLPRNSVHPHLHKDVDVLLRELKSCMRRLQTATGCYTNEMRVLERLYYKNKNQHRTALFFQRISEIRRYGNRLGELKLSESVELLRATFFGFPTTREWVIGFESHLMQAWNWVVLTIKCSRALGIMFQTVLIWLSSWRDWCLRVNSLTRYICFLIVETLVLTSSDDRAIHPRLPVSFPVCWISRRHLIHYLFQVTLLSPCSPVPSFNLLYYFRQYAVGCRHYYLN